MKYRVEQGNALDKPFKSAAMSKVKAEKVLAGALAANERLVRQYTDASLPVPERVATYFANIVPE